MAARIESGTREATTINEQRHLAQQKDEQVRELLEQKRLAWQAAKSDENTI